MDEIRKRQQKGMFPGGQFTQDVNAGVYSGGGSGSGMQQSLLTADPEMERMEGIAAQRSGEIAKIAATMNEIQHLFKDMGQLVIEQGSVLDRIDFNLEEMVERGAKANKELKKAEATKKGSDRRALQCMGLMALGNIIMLFVLLIKYKVKYGWSIVGMIEYMVLMVLAASISFYLVRYKPYLCHKACPKFAWWVLPAHTNPDAPKSKSGGVSGVFKNVRQKAQAMNMAGQVAGAAGGLGAAGQAAAFMRQ